MTSCPICNKDVKKDHEETEAYSCLEKIAKMFFILKQLEINTR